MSDVPNYERAMCDTNLLCHAFSPVASDKQRIARVILSAARAGDIELFVPTIALVELWKVPDKNLSLEQLATMNAVLAGTDDYVYVDLDRTAATVARELALQYGISNPYDAAVLGCATQANVEVLLTWDGKDFDLGTRYGDILVAEPYWYGDMPMFDP